MRGGLTVEDRASSSRLQLSHGLASPLLSSPLLTALWASQPGGALGVSLSPRPDSIKIKEARLTEVTGQQDCCVRHTKYAECEGLSSLSY